jgi:hypothetical protein
MAIERGRDARYARTGLTDMQRDQRILQLAAAGYPQRVIAKDLQMSQTAVCHILGRLHGNPRRVVSLGMCEGCWEDFPKVDLDASGLCPTCRD